MATLSELAEAVRFLNEKTAPVRFELRRSVEGNFMLARDDGPSLYWMGETKALALARLEAFSEGFSAGLEALVDAGG